MPQWRSEYHDTISDRMLSLMTIGPNVEMAKCHARYDTGGIIP